MGLAREWTNIHLQPGVRWQYVNRPAGAQHRLCDGGVGKRMCISRKRAELFIIGVGGGAIDKHLLRCLIKFESPNETFPRLIRHRRWLRGGNPACNLCYLDHRKVLAKGRGTMPGIAVDVNTALAGTLFTDIKTNCITAI